MSISVGIGKLSAWLITCDRISRSSAISARTVSQFSTYRIPYLCVSIAYCHYSLMRLQDLEPPPRTMVAFSMCTWFADDTRVPETSTDPSKHQWNVVQGRSLPLRLWRIISHAAPPHLVTSLQCMDTDAPLLMLPCRCVCPIPMPMGEATMCQPHRRDMCKFI